MRVAVIGAGMLAWHVADTLIERGIEHEVLGHDRIEMADPVSIIRALDGFDFAVNTAALHRLRECEDKPTLAKRVNHVGAATVASTVPTVYISTDYVFTDGGPHDEVMPGQRPPNVYGITKLGGELATLEAGGCVVRVSGLYSALYKSHKGEDFPTRVLTTFQPLELPTDQVTSPTYAPHAAKLIAAVVADPERQGVYHAVNQGSASWCTFGQSVIEAASYNKRRRITGVERHDPLYPRNTALRNTRLPALPHWRVALDEWYAEFERRLYANAVSPLRANP